MAAADWGRGATRGWRVPPTRPHRAGAGEVDRAQQSRRQQSSGRFRGRATSPRTRQRLSRDAPVIWQPSARSEPTLARGAPRPCPALVGCTWVPGQGSSGATLLGHLRWAGPGRRAVQGSRGRRATNRCPVHAVERLALHGLASRAADFPMSDHLRGISARIGLGAAPRTTTASSWARRSPCLPQRADPPSSPPARGLVTRLAVLEASDHPRTPAHRGALVGGGPLLLARLIADAEADLEGACRWAATTAA